MKQVVVTGSANGMGRAVAVKLAKEGYKVFSLDIKKNEEEIEGIKQIVCDVTDLKSVEKARDEVLKETDKLDAVLNFAGIIMMNSLVEISEEEFVRIYNINLFGVYRINKTFFPLVHKTQGKILITTSELAPNKILPFNAIYAISKKALDAYAEGLRMELGLLGVKVITLRPGAVSTQLIDNSNKTMQKLEENTTLYKSMTAKFKHIMDKEQGTAISPEKIANLVYKILEKKRNKFVYTKNASIKLKMFNLVPAKMQLKLLKILLK